MKLGQPNPETRIAEIDGSLAFEDREFSGSRICEIRGD
jgi:hypothetical protein